MRRRTAYLGGGLAVLYLAAACVCTPKLEHAWWYLQENATRRFPTFLGLTAANVAFPWCFVYERRALSNLASRGVRAAWTADLFARLPGFAGAEHIDARMLCMSRMKALLEDFRRRHGGYRLWCVGRWDYLVTPRDPKGMGNLPVPKLLATFADEGTFADLARVGIYSPADLMASYLGNEREIAPAFDAFPAYGALRGAYAGIRTAFLPEPTEGGASVRATYLTPAAGADMRWLKKGETERDVYAAFVRDVLAKQAARRKILLAFDKAEAGKREEALADWTAAAATNPRDPVLVALGEAMDREATAYLSFGNTAAALTCWQNRHRVFPRDPATLHNIAAVLSKAGQSRLAMQVLQRAKALEAERGR